MNQKVMGINPGRKTGFCFLIDGKIKYINTQKLDVAKAAIQGLQDEYGNFVVGVEFTERSSVHSRPKSSLSTGEETELRLRRNRKQARELIDFCEMCGLEVQILKPEGKALDKKEFEKRSGWKCRSSDISRNAWAIADRLAGILEKEKT